MCGIKSALRLSSQTGFPEWDYSDDSSDSEDEIPSNQVIKPCTYYTLSGASFQLGSVKIIQTKLTPASECYLINVKVFWTRKFAQSKA